MKAPVTTAKEALFIETGKLPMQIIISMRRIMYWWHILKQDKSSMIYKVYDAERNKPVKGDWIHLLEKDKKEFDIVIEDDEMLERFKSKYSIKSYISKKAKIIAFDYLQRLKMKHSKIDGINFEEVKCSEYILDPQLNKKEVRLLFKLRTRMYNVKANFSSMYNFNLLCDLCKSQICSQEHLMQCKVLKLSVPELVQNTDVKYHHIFESISNMVSAIKLLSKVISIRVELLEAKSDM